MTISPGAVAVSSTQSRVRVPVKRIRELVAFVASREGKSIETADIAVVGACRMATLNRRYLGHGGATDVLSFDLGPGPTGGACVQIIVCSDVAIRQAKRRGHAAWRELLLYITHGLLHLMGHDDRTADGARRMHRREDELLAAFGIGEVYGDV
jgi:probable rRNA maturation factor